MNNEFVPLEWNELTESEMRLRATALYEQMNLRRTTRHFSERTVPREFIEKAIMCGSTAPWLVILFRQSKRMRPNGEFGPTYYSSESCGIAAGMFIQAIHNMGLVTLTHTPSPMGFLREILGRPAHEHAMLVMPVGYPAEDAAVPNLSRKPLEDVAIFVE